jgi:hypothetical protein
MSSTENSPLDVTDEQMTMINRASDALLPPDRPAFLAALADRAARRADCRRRKHRPRDPGTAAAIFPTAKVRIARGENQHPRSGTGNREGRHSRAPGARLRHRKRHGERAAGTAPRSGSQGIGTTPPTRGRGSPHKRQFRFYSFGSSSFFCFFGSMNWIELCTGVERSTR